MSSLIDGWIALLFAPFFVSFFLVDFSVVCMNPSTAVSFRASEAYMQSLTSNFALRHSKPKRNDSTHVAMSVSSTTLRPNQSMAFVMRFATSIFFLFVFSCVQSTFFFNVQTRVVPDSVNLRDLNGVFACQCCFQPLLLDESLLDVDIAITFDNFSGE